MDECKHLPTNDAGRSKKVLFGAASSSHQRKSNDEIYYNEPLKQMLSVTEDDVDIDMREVYFLIMHFLSSGPCQRTCGQLWNELLEHKLLPRRYHAWYSRKGLTSGDEDDDGLSYPLNYTQLVNRYAHIEKDHLVKLLKQLLKASAGNGVAAADVPTLLGVDSFSLLESKPKGDLEYTRKGSSRWPHSESNQVHALFLREIGGGFAKHHRAPSIRAASHAIAKPSTLLENICIIKTLRGHRNAVYCAIFDRSGQYVITGSDDRLVKIWSMETGFCLSSCRGHEGDITDLAVSFNNVLVASASNDCIIRVWRLPDGLPISVLRGHTLSVTAIAFSPRQGCEHHLLSSSDDGTCRIWDSRDGHVNPRIYTPKREENLKVNEQFQVAGQRESRILCCAFNASGTIFVTGSSDTFARVWNAIKRPDEVANQPIHELDTLSGHENDVNYVQFSGSAVPARAFSMDSWKDDKMMKFKNSWFTHDNIVTCSRDGSAIIWIPRSRKYHGRVGRWARAYHLKVPPPPVPPQQPRGGPRQRMPPTPRGVNMIVWSLDNRFVLAAIMDCRICVWNSVDGSLVHSLTGHTQSTYVLDVHPFDPRIAMSAGYDGKAIIWDIWEGTPIKTYSTGEYKLVDGKFSPDGTSIVLSDEVGQIHILTTGEGKSQKAAMFDQFFFRDYQPLVHDANGNVLDQETQLAPYHLNLQDPLCDSFRIPYSEPYQSMYQQRRLGVLGIDWQPTSLRPAIGGATQEDILAQLPVQTDLDRGRWLAHPAELGDGLEWDLENDIQSDDTGSEYNVTEESSSEDQNASLNEESFDDSESSYEEDNSDTDSFSKACHHKSSKRKRKMEDSVPPSVVRKTRRHLQEQDRLRFKLKRHTNAENGKSVLEEEFLSDKSSRPQRRAAKNALQLFSAMEGSLSGESLQGSGSQGNDYSNQERNRYGSEIQTPSSSRQDIFHENEEFINAAPLLHLNDKSVDPRVIDSNKPKRLVIRVKAQNSGKSVPCENANCNSYVDDKMVSLPGGSREVLHEEKERVHHNSNQVQSVEPKLGCTGSDILIKGEGLEKLKEQSPIENIKGNLLYQEGNHIKWGEVKARRAKRLKNDSFSRDTAIKGKMLGDSSFYTHSCQNSNINFENFNSQISNNQSCINLMSSKRETSDLQFESCQENSSDKQANETQTRTPVSIFENFETNTGNINSSKRIKRDSSQDLEQLLQENRFCKEISSDFDTKDCQVEDNWSQGEMQTPNGYGIGNSSFKDDDDINDFRFAEIEENTENGSNAENGDCDYAIPENIHSKFGKVVTRSKRSTKDTNTTNRVGKTNQHDFSRLGGMSLENCSARKVVMRNSLCGTSGSKNLQHLNHDNENGGSYESDEHAYLKFDDKSDISYGLLRTKPQEFKFQNIKLKFTSNNNNGSQRTRTKQSKDSGRTCSERYGVRGQRAEKTKKESLSSKGYDSDRNRITANAKWGSTSKYLCGARTNNNKNLVSFRRSGACTERNSGKQTIKKQSWLLISHADQGHRYIPQLGDEVAYLRQGHEELLAMSQLQERGPWKAIKGNIKYMETCRVECLEYATVAGSGETCCKLTLKFIDPLSDVFGKIFKLNLPEVTPTADFVVEKSCYEAAIRRNWTIRDKCRVWWRDDKGEDDNGEEGSWYPGRVIAIKPKSEKFPDSPWDRYHVQYKGDSGGPQVHSPWELFDLEDYTAGQPNYTAEQPKIDSDLKFKLLHALEEIEESSYVKGDCYGLAMLSELLEKPEFLNRVPLPLSLDIVKTRLENDYYRHLEAFKNDIHIMVLNTQIYITKYTTLSVKLQKFEKKILKVIES